MKLFVLIGLPGSGKSTWRENFLAEADEPVVVISQDDLVEEFAKAEDVTYSQAFELMDLKAAAKKVKANFLDAMKGTDTVILDRTNMTVKGRKTFLQSVPKTWEKIAVVFDVDHDVLRRRLKERGEATGKVIPDRVMIQMINTYQPPTLEEFDQILTVRVAKENWFQKFTHYVKHRLPFFDE